MENTVFDSSKFKICSRCKTIKQLSSFGKRTTAKDGLKSTCKSCDSAWQKQWYINQGKDYYKNLKQQPKANTV